MILYYYIDVSYVFLHVLCVAEV